MKELNPLFEIILIFMIFKINMPKPLKSCLRLKICYGKQIHSSKVQLSGIFVVKPFKNLQIHL